MAKEQDLMDKIVSLAKRRGFIYPGSEIYGGLAGTYDYGPLGIALKRNITNLWWSMFVDGREDMYGVDAAILMNAKVWEASGHVGGFSDPLVDCLSCQSRFRVDQILDIERYQNYLNWLLHDAEKELGEVLKSTEESANLREYIKSGVQGENLSLQLKESARKAYGGRAQLKILLEELVKAADLTGRFTKFYLDEYINCPKCSKNAWGTPRQFNMMLKTHVGSIETAENVSYLRPETAGGMFVNYKNVLDSLHPKLPFGLGQIGKAFRNEIAPRDFIFRVRELEQMEVEYFVKPEYWKDAFEEWRKSMWNFIDAVGIDREHVYELEVAPEDRAHYSERTIDFEFDFPFGRKELYGLAYRTDFDLKAHAKGSGQDLSYFDEETKERLVPHVIEPSFGVERTVLAVLASAYKEDEMNGDVRPYLKLPASIAPYRACVSPLLKNKPELVSKAREVFVSLKKTIPNLTWDDNGNIGKRYRRQDEIGTPYCVTIDFDTLENDTVTVRDRDTGEQKRVAIADLMAAVR